MAWQDDDLLRVQRMLREGRASVTGIDEHGTTVLMFTIMEGRPVLARWLMEHGGASIGAVDYQVMASGMLLRNI
jgi:hypothetical protein